MKDFLKKTSSVCAFTQNMRTECLWCILKALDLDGKGGREELGGAEGEETEIRVYYMKKNYIQGKKKLNTNTVDK